jgi:hypothetical protein
MVNRAMPIAIYCLFAFGALAAPFEDETLAIIGETGDWSNKVELADINGDGAVDILFANGGKYSSAGTPEVNTVYLNQESGPFISVGDAIFGSGDLARAIKVRDLNDDDVPDIIVATTFQTQSRLLLGLGDGKFVEVTGTHLPQNVGSFGDVALGDVDGDGDIDLVLADWGPGNPLSNEGGITRLWLNNGFGAFIDATSEKMPTIPVEFSWELELVDVDNDWDLDVLVSCKSCSGSKLFHNDGTGNFTDASDALPQFSNNYDFEAMDMNGDGFLDLVTINDGPGLREHLLISDGAGGFINQTEALWPSSANIGEDDNMVIFLDYDSDGDADFLIGSLSGEDRLLLNDGTGKLSLQTQVFSGSTTPGTLGIALADINGDTKLDVVHAQGEVASPEKVFLGVDIPPDTAPPTIGITSVQLLDDGGLRFRARVHDRKSPVMPHDFSSIEVRWSANRKQSQNQLPMRWMGEYLFWADITSQPADAITWQICATDRAGNTACSELETTAFDGGPVPEPTEPEDTETDTNSRSRVESESDADIRTSAENELDVTEGITVEPTSDNTQTDAAGSSTTPIQNVAGNDDGGCSSRPNSPEWDWNHLLLLGICFTMLRYRFRAGPPSRV